MFVAVEGIIGLKKAMKCFGQYVEVIKKLIDTLTSILFFARDGH